jgi:hypothetical protein
MSVVVVISQHLLNVFVQLANKRGLKKKSGIAEKGMISIARQRSVNTSAVSVPLLGNSPEEERIS